MASLNAGDVLSECLECRLVLTGAPCLGNALTALGRKPEAAAAYAEAVRLDPTLAGRRGQRGPDTTPP